jgi:hypothetical protein
MRRLVATLLVIGSALAARGAVADDSAHEKAVRAFAAGRAAIEAGDCKAAIAKLQEANAFEPSVGAHFSLADCHEQLDLLAAWRDLKAAESLAARNQDEREQVARKRAADLEPKLPTFRLVVPPAVSAAPGFRIRLDESTMGADIYGDGIVATTPGPHDLEVSAPNKKTFTRHIIVAAPRSGGSVETVTVVLEEDASRQSAPALEPARGREPPPVAAPEAPPGRSRRTAALVLGGVGLVGVGVGAVAGILALGKSGDINDTCTGKLGSCDPNQSGTVSSDVDAARRFATVSDIGFIAGGAMLAGAAILWFTAPRADVALTPTVGPSQAGLSGLCRW